MGWWAGGLVGWWACVCARVSWRWCVMGWWAGGLVLFDDVCAARPLLYFLRALGYALGLANEGFAFLFWGVELADETSFFFTKVRTSA